jgi:hypothetical protein
MKASELIKFLQEEFDAFGDRDIVYLPCNCVDPTAAMEPIHIGAIGWYGDQRNTEDLKSAISLECAECHHQALIDKANLKAGDYD